MEWGWFVRAGHFFVASSRGWRWSLPPSLRDEGRSYLLITDVSLGDEERWSFHAVFSVSFGSPVLYFTGSSPEGRLVSDDAVRRLFPLPVVVSQGEHPVLGRPFFFVHPCETGRVMGLLGAGQHVFLSSWWSWIAPPYPANSFPQTDRKFPPPSEIVSVVVPCYNGAPFLAEMCQSISAQSCRKRIEIVFCDDNSADGSREEFRRNADKFLSDRSRFIVTELRNSETSGAGVSRNRCIEVALGDYLCFLDCDDVMHSSRIELQLTELIEREKKSDFDGDVIVSCQLVPFPTNSPFYDAVNAIVDPDELIAHRFREITCPLPTWFVSRQTLAKTGHFLSLRDHPEDLDFFLRHIERGGCLAKIAIPLLNYRIHSAQLSRRIHRNLLMQYKAKHFCEFLKNSNFWQKFQIWGSGRDGKKFFKYLDDEIKLRVSAFLEISEKRRKTTPKLGEISLLGIEHAKPPFVSCVSAGKKNNGMTEKLEGFRPGTDYFQMC